MVEKEFPDMSGAASNEWRKLQAAIHCLQQWCHTPEELRMLSEVLTLIETHLYEARE